MTPTGTGRRPLAFAFVALWLALAGNFAGTAHWLLVPHRLCEVHNRWEHVSEQENSARALPAEEHAGEPVYRSEGKAHENCSLDFFARIEPSIPDVRSPSADALAPQQSRELCTRTIERHSSVALLLLAPKHSPPA